MNSQQELLDAINTIGQKKDKSFDTPATVLRVEGDTVWVHIDGGADETPVNKTISCAEGETVQVRISNGSAFLVGNASAPPTDDKTANVAHFVAEQADEKATDAIRSVNAIEQTVSEKVSAGDSNVRVLSSTMIQNANGVNIYNNTLAVGDSYAHIDGDSFDIKESTTAGQIDDVNDPVCASFGANESVINSNNGTYENQLKLSSSELLLTRETISSANSKTGWKITPDKIQSTGMLDTYNVFLDKSTPQIFVGPANTGQDQRKTIINNSSVEVRKNSTDYVSVMPQSIHIGSVLNFVDRSIDIYDDGRIALTGDIYAWEEIGGFYEITYKKTPTVLESTSISASATTYTFSNTAIKADSVIDIYDTIFGFAPTAISVSAGSATITFPAQSSSHKIKLFVY